MSGAPSATGRPPEQPPGRGSGEPPHGPPAQPPTNRRPTRISSLHIGLLVAALLLLLLIIFLAQNGQQVAIDFFTATLHVPLALALLGAAVAGALIVGVAGTARIAQLRRTTRRSRRRRG